MRWPRRRRSCEFPRHFSPFTVPVMDFRVASNLASFRVAGLSDSASCPASSRLRATPAGAVLGFPLVLHLPALPAIEPRVAPILASFGGADLAEPQVAPLFRPSVSPTIHRPGCPELRIFRHWLVIVPSHPGCFHLPALPAANLRISPDLLIPWLHQLRELPSCPGSSHLWRRRLTY